MPGFSGQRSYNTFVCPSILGDVYDWMNTAGCSAASIDYSGGRIASLTYTNCNTLPPNPSCQNPGGPNEPDNNPHPLPPPKPPPPATF